METFKMANDSPLKLKVKISSDAIVGSNVRLEEKIIKKSIAYQFDSNMGNTKDLKNKKVTIVSNFFVHDGNIDVIMNNTNVIYTFIDNDNSIDYSGKKLKIDDEMFMIYALIKLV